MVESIQRVRGPRSIIACAALTACTWLALVAPAALGRRPPDAVTTAATGVGSRSATLTGVVAPNGVHTTYFFEYGTSGYDARTPLISAGEGREPIEVSAPVGGLSPATTYRVRLVAFSTTHVAYGEDVTFATQAAEPAAAPPPAPPAPPTLVGSPLAPGAFEPTPPVLGERVNVTVREGTVMVKVPGGSRFEPVSEFASIPVGSRLNTRQGSVRLRSALASGGIQAGVFYGGIFEVRQPAAAGGMTVLILRGPRPRCRAAAGSAAAVAAGRRKPPRALWGRTRRGNFRTRGGNSVATVRGTVWYVRDRCDGTLTRVRRGTVAVRDLRRHRTVVLRAGDRYLARSTR